MKSLKEWQKKTDYEKKEKEFLEFLDQMKRQPGAHRLIKEQGISGASAPGSLQGKANKFTQAAAEEDLADRPKLKLLLQAAEGLQYTGEELMDDVKFLIRKKLLPSSTHLLKVCIVTSL